MRDYYESEAKSIGVIPLRVSNEDAQAVATQIIQNVEAMDQLSSDAADLLQLEMVENGAMIQSEMYGETNLDAYEHCVEPFLEQCADPTKPWLIKSSWTGEFEYGSRTLHFHFGQNQDYRVDDDEALDFVLHAVNNNLAAFTNNGKLTLSADIE